MEQTEDKKESTVQPSNINDAVASSPESHADNPISLQAGTGITPSCGAPRKSSCRSGSSMLNGSGMTYSYVYALGKVMARFPSLAVEKEFAQAAGRAETTGLTDQQTFHSVLSKRENRYLARKLCWVFTIEGLDTYILQPRDPGDFELLVEAIRPIPSPMDIDAVIGMKGPIAPPEMCNGLMVPIVGFDQMYSFGIDVLIKSIPRPETIPEEEFEAAAKELFWRIMQMTDNAGATDEHRALNYLTVRYPAIYAKAVEEFGRNFSLTAVEVRPSPLSSVRKIVDVVFSYTQRETDFTEKFFVRVDVTEEFPFLVTKMSPYYDR